MRALTSRLGVLAAALATGAALLAACGSDGDAAPTATPEPTATEEARAEPTSARDFWQSVEADPAPDLPGKFVDLQTIYGAAYGGAPNTAPHVSVTLTYAEQGLPPAGGPHWSGACGDDPSAAPPFCGPVPWGIYREPWAAESVVHNMEHGGVAVWYNLDDQAVIDEIETIVADLLGQGLLIVMMPYAEIPADTIALTSWGRRDVISVDEYTPDRIVVFIDAHERRFNPESF